MDKNLLWLAVAVGIGLIWFLVKRKKRNEFKTVADHLSDLATKGILPKLNAGVPANIALQSGEGLVGVFPETTLVKPRAVREWHGAYAGPSIRIAKGFWMRLGGSAGHSESHDELRAIDTGTLVFTDERLVFVGSMRSISIPLEKLISVEGSSDALLVHREGKETIEGYVLGSGKQMTYEYDGHTLAAPLDGRFIKTFIDLAILLHKNLDQRGVLTITNGDRLLAQGKVDEALKVYQDAFAIMERAVMANPRNADNQHVLAGAADRIGNVFKERGDFTEALKFYRDAFAIGEGSVKANPSNTQAQRDLFVFYEHIGDVLGEQGKFGEALESYRNGLAIVERLAKAEPGTWQKDLGGAVGKLSWLSYKLLKARKLSEALRLADHAISLAPDLIWINLNRAHALMFLGQVDEARAIYLKYAGHQQIQGEKSWDTIALEDFAQLRKAGLAHPLMDEVEKLFTEQRTGRKVVAA
jgi:tetratricopeptide (TPR) repeat protein